MIVKKYIIPFIFITSLSAIGQKITVGYVPLTLSFIFLASSSKEDFVITIFILCFNFGIVEFDTLFNGIKSYDVIIPLVSIVFLISISLGNYKLKNNDIIIILRYYIFFLFVNVLIELHSADNITSKLAGFRQLFGFLFILFPLLVYRNESANAEKLLSRLTEYWYVFSLLIIAQAFIIKYPIFFTANAKGVIGGYERSYNNLAFRVYPPAFSLMIFYLFYITDKSGSKKNLKVIDILRNFLAALGSLTRSLWGAIIGSIFLTVPFSRKVKYGLMSIVVVWVLLEIERQFGIDLRLTSFFDQIYLAVKYRDYLSLGTGRYLQAQYPIYYFINNLDTFWGVGLLSPEKSSVSSYFSPFFIGANHFITEVEVGYAAYFIACGIIGIANLIYFLISIWKVVKKYNYANLYKQLIAFILIAQIGGFFSFLGSDTWGILGMTVALISLSGKSP